MWIRFLERERERGEHVKGMTWRRERVKSVKKSGSNGNGERARNNHYYNLAYSGSVGRSRISFSFQVSGSIIFVYNFWDHLILY